MMAANSGGGTPLLSNFPLPDRNAKNRIIPGSAR
jgi:hypothetical protein